MLIDIASARPRLIPSTRFLLAVLVCFGFLVQYAQRINMSIAIVCMVDKTRVNHGLQTNYHLIHNNSGIIQRTSLLFKEQKFFWNEWDQQIVLGSYWGGYLLTLVPSGWLSITMGAKKLFAMSIFISSLATIALSSAYFLQSISFFLVVGLRILIGAAHGVLFPVTYYLWAQWAVPDERGTLSSVGFCGTNLGTSFIVLTGGLLCRYVDSGWIHIFLLSGILGFLWLPLWMWKVTDSPEEHPSISKNERDYIQNIIGKNAQSKNRRPISLGSLPWKNIVQSKPVIGLFVTEFCNLFGLFFFLTNLGKILTEIHQIPTQYSGYVLSSGFLCMLFGSVSSGTMADILVRRKIMTLTRVRKLFNSLTSFIPCLCMVSFYFCDEKRQTLGVFTVLLFLLSSGFGYGSGYLVNFADIVPAFAGLIFGIVTAISSLGAVIGNIIAGILIKQPTLYHWRQLFILYFIIYFIGGIVYIFLGSAVPQKWAILKSQTQEETIPMNEQKEKDELKAVEDANINVKA